MYPPLFFSPSFSPPLPVSLLSSDLPDLSLCALCGSAALLFYSVVDALFRQRPKFVQPPSTSASGSSGRQFVNAEIVVSL